jgi:signal transduction histidine kinase
VFSTFTVPVYHEINTNIINYVLLIAQNITKEAEALKNLEESEAELKKSNASKDRFFSIIAHDLKNPLGGFVNLCKLLVEDFQKMNDIEKMETISTMYDSAVHLFGLLENLLEWSRAQRNVIKYEPELYNIKNFVDYNFNLVKSSAAKKRIHLILNVPDSIIVFCDFNTINTVIRNILSNAVKFTYEGGAIIISATENDRYCNLIIKDNGVGISEDNLKKFFQIDCIVSHPGTNNEKGTGLGLIICKEFIEMNHGSIKIESINMKGTTVEISIPKAKSF